MVEEQSATVEDHRANGFELPEYISGGDTQHLDALRLKPAIPRFIALGAIAHVVRHAIDLDRQPGLGAIEIENERAEWMLSAETQAVRT